MDRRLPTIYAKTLGTWPSWEVSLPQLGDRHWNLASAGKNNPLQLDSELLIDGMKVTFIEQMRIWCTLARQSVHGNVNPLPPQFENCLAVAEDNGDLLLIGPDGDSLYVFHHDGMDVERVFDSMENFVGILSSHSQATLEPVSDRALPD